MATESSARLPALAAAMREPGFYPHRPASVEFKQTHISYLFLAGEYVYKVKKPVRFPFLDYSTLEKRLHFCREEVRLNRRLAPDVYLGVARISRAPDGYRLDDADAKTDMPPVEYAVRMVRLPEERLLDRLAASGRVTPEEIRAIARKLVSFHRSAASDRAALYGAPEAIRRQVEENFRETEAFVGRTVSERMLGRARDYSLDFLAAHRALFEARVKEGKVREGHGDLRSEHICLVPGLPIFDCVEFSEPFRYGDAASEIAFLAMDLDFLDASDLAEKLAAACAEIGKDNALRQLLPFYRCYRAYVRGKVESLKAGEPEVPETEQENARLRAERYFFLADRYVRGPARPALAIVFGLVASGKSTVARRLADATGFRVFNSDVVRKRLAQVRPTERASADYRAGIYSDAFTRRTYQTLLDEAERNLRAGRGVIVDATFRDPAQRRLFLERATAAGWPLLFIECRAGEKEILRRLEERERTGDRVSDAGREVFLRMREEFVPPDEIPDHMRITLDTGAGARDSIENVVERIRGSSH